MRVTLSPSQTRSESRISAFLCQKSELEVSGPQDVLAEAERWRRDVGDDQGDSHQAPRLSAGGNGELHQQALRCSPPGPGPGVLPSSPQLAQVTVLLGRVAVNKD